MVLPAGTSGYGTAYDSGWDLHSADSYLPVFIPVSSPLHLCWNCGILRGTGVVDWSFLQPAALFRLVCDRTYCMQCDCHCLNRHALHAATSWCSKTAASFLMASFAGSTIPCQVYLHDSHQARNDSLSALLKNDPPDHYLICMAHSKTAVPGENRNGSSIFNN